MNEWLSETDWAISFLMFVLPTCFLLPTIARMIADARERLRVLRIMRGDDE